MKKLLATVLLAALALAALLLAQSSSNHGWTPHLKPGSIITKEEIERLGESGWRVVRAESLYLYRGFSRLYGRCNTTLVLAEALRPSEWGETGAADFRAPEAPRRGREAQQRRQRHHLL